jgi:hypothetical protein
MTGVQPLLGEITVSFEEVTGLPVIRQVHVAHIPSTEYMMILGGDLLTAVGGTIRVSARSWKIRPSGRHVNVSEKEEELC